MKRIPSLILLAIALLTTTALHAQTAMGGWRTHFAYNSVTQMAQTPHKVYAVSNGALFSIDKLDGNVELYSKISGLNGSVVAAIKYDDARRQLLICYDNGNIDLLTEGGIVNIPDFYNKVMTVNKSIAHINIHGDKAYLSCHFGIIVLNLARREIAETYYIGSNASEVDVLSTTVHDGHLYALTFTPLGAAEGTDKDTQVPNRKYGLYRASLDNPNLANYEAWSTVALPQATDYQALAAFADRLFIQSDWSVFQHNNNDNTWSRFNGIPIAVSAGISVSNGKMIVSDRQANIYAVDENLQTRHLPGIVQHASAGEYDPTSDTYWFAADDKGIVSYQATDGTRNEIKPNGPYVNSAWDLAFAGEKLFVVPGGRWSERYAWPGYVMIYENGKWTNIQPSDIFPDKPHLVQDFVNVAIDPQDASHFFISSYGTGLYEFKGNRFAKRYLSDVFEDASGVDPDHYTRVDGAVFDSQGNLFVANSSANNGAIKILLPDGTWLHRTYAGLDRAATLGKILINEKNSNQKWILSVRHDSRGIGVFDDNGTLKDPSDDRSVFMTSLIDSDNPEERITPEYLYCIAQDKNGVIWIGTKNGPLLFHNTEKVFDAGYTCSRVKISRNDGTNQADYLLADEVIKAIAIDGANRKWIGTNASGVYLLSENGQETIHHFTTENSPLLSNEIFDIDINPLSGEVFFATGAGVISYQSDAAEETGSFDNVYAYPNPVRENFNGIITITGLIANTQVKITDLNGNLICETISNGSIATWDGKDAWGRKVSTGIYLALCITEDGKESTITKIMVIN